MSRSGYVEEVEDPLAYGRWRAAVKSALHGKRGQALLRDLAQTLDAMEDKRLYPGSFATAEGEYCTLGVLGAKRGIKMDDLGDEYDCDTKRVGERFGIAPAMAAEIMWLNDEYLVEMVTWHEEDLCGPVRPNWPDFNRKTFSVLVKNPDHARERWLKMREWINENIKD